MATKKISEILRDAADLLEHGDPTLPEKLLMPTDTRPGSRHIPVTYCCWAICLAMGRKWAGTDTSVPAVRFLMNLGMPVNCAFEDMYEDRTVGKWEIQQTRYAWLQLAADIAEEQGL